MTSQTAAATTTPTSIGLAGQPVLPRVASIDIFRGLTMMVMIFVNELAGVKGLPWWTHHVPANVDAMTYVDMVFPAFLFIVGMSVPLAVQARLRKDSSPARLWLHVILRALSLVVLGLILANAQQGSRALMGIPTTWWAFIALLGAVLFWNVYGRSSRYAPFFRVLKIIGAGLLLAMFAIFRRTTQDGHVAWIDFSYWEILGLIGWAYLSVCILYIPTRRWRWMPFVWFVLLLLLNIASTAKWTRVGDFPSYIWPFESGASAEIVMAGVATSAIFIGWHAQPFSRKLLWSACFAATSFLAGWLLTPLGISKIRATPTWCLYSIGSSILIFTALYWVCDMKRHTAWASLVRPAGANTLTTYLLPDFYYFAFWGTAVETAFAYGFPGVIRSVVFTLVMLALAAVVTKCKIRMQL